MVILVVFVIVPFVASVGFGGASVRRHLVHENLGRQLCKNRICRLIRTARHSFRIKRPKFTYARRDLRSALLVSFGASVARYSGHAVFARTLSGCVIARLSGRADWMTVARWNIRYARIKVIEYAFNMNWK